MKISRMLRTSVVLPTPGPPVMTSIFCWHACRNCLLLPGRELDPQLPFDPGDRLFNVDSRHGVRRGRCDSLNGLGKAHLGPVQRGQVEPGFPLDLFTNNCLFGHRGPYRLLNDDLVDLDQSGGVVNDARLREANVPLAGKLLKRVADGGPCPVRAVAVDSQLGGQFVGRLEADPSNVVGQAGRGSP